MLQKLSKVYMNSGLDTEEGKKTQFLEVIEENGLNLSSRSGILCTSGPYSVQCFKALYNLFFDETGNKTRLLKIMEYT